MIVVVTDLLQHLDVIALVVDLPQRLRFWLPVAVDLLLHLLPGVGFRCATLPVTQLLLGVFVLLLPCVIWLLLFTTFCYHLLTFTLNVIYDVVYCYRRLTPFTLPQRCNGCLLTRYPSGYSDVVLCTGMACCTPLPPRDYSGCSIWNVLPFFAFIY